MCFDRVFKVAEAYRGIIGDTVTHGFVKRKIAEK